MTDSRRTKFDSSPDAMSLPERVRKLETMLEVISLPESHPAPSQQVSSEVARVRVSLVRACKAFRRLGNGSFALAGFIWVAFLTALFAGQLALLPALVGGAGGLFLALVGYVFHMQADSIDLGDSNDRL